MVPREVSCTLTANFGIVAFRTTNQRRLAPCVSGWRVKSPRPARSRWRAGHGCLLPDNRRATGTPSTCLRCSCMLYILCYHVQGVYVVQYHASPTCVDTSCRCQSMKGAVAISTKLCYELCSLKPNVLLLQAIPCRSGTGITPSCSTRGRGNGPVWRPAARAHRYIGWRGH